MRNLLLIVLLAGYAAAQAPANPTKSQTPDAASTQKPAHTPNLAPPRSDSVNVDALDDSPGDSSSKETQIDVTPPPGDAKAHPDSANPLKDEGSDAASDVNEMRPWDPHRAAKDIEVGDYYFKRKNYLGAESRYREALYYKDNDAVATFRLAVCLEKMDRLDEARTEYEAYLKILPNGPQAPEAKKSLDRLKSATANAKPEK
jgi:tetratricopeptide (TPR) repeat protein